MNNTRKHSILAFGLLACLVLGGTADAHTGQSTCALGVQTGGQGQGLAQGHILVANAVGAASAAQIAQGRYGGEVLRVNKRGDLFHVKLRTSGGVIVVCVSATSGQIVGC